jgi:hypothetical protein
LLTDLSSMAIAAHVPEVMVFVQVVLAGDMELL